MFVKSCQRKVSSPESDALDAQVSITVAHRRSLLTIGSARTNYRPPRPSKAEDHVDKKARLEDDDEVDENVQQSCIPQSDGAGEKTKREPEPQPVCFHHPGPVFEDVRSCLGNESRTLTVSTVLAMLWQALP